MAGGTAEVRGERHGVDGHEGNARLQARGQCRRFAQERACQVGVRVRDHQFQFAAEGVCAELAGVNSKFAAGLHVSHLH